MKKTIEYPFQSEYKKFECYYKVYKPNKSGDINVTLRLNTVNDKATYRWTYGNIKDYKEVGATAFFKPLKALIKELEELEYCWEWEVSNLDKRKYIITSFLTNIPVYDGATNMIDALKAERQSHHNAGPIMHMRTYN